MELAPVFLIGDFGVVPAKAGWRIMSEMPVLFGSWKNMGMPFYPGKVEYTKIVDLTRQARKQRSFWANGTGHVPPVSVNDIVGG